MDNSGKRIFSKCVFGEEVDKIVCYDCGSCGNNEVCLELRRQAILKRQKQERREAARIRREKEVRRLCVFAFVSVLVIIAVLVMVINAEANSFADNSPVNNPNSTARVSSRRSNPKEIEVSAEEEEKHDAEANQPQEPEKVSEIPSTPVHFEAEGAEETMLTEGEEPSTEAKAIPVVSAEGPSEEYFYNISYEDKVLMAKVVYVEAGGEPYKGKVGVAAVILNRFFGTDKDFDRRSIYTIITQRNAFASIASVTDAKLEANPDCMRAVEDACKGYDPTRDVFPNGGATYFYNPNGISEAARAQRTGIVILEIGAHNFHNQLAG